MAANGIEGYLKVEVGLKEGPIYCDCCPGHRHEKLGEIRDGKLILMDRRHGVRHVAVVPLGGFDKVAKPC